MKISKMLDFKKKLSIIIVNYHSERHAKKCLESLFGLYPGADILEIILVNNDESEKIFFLRETFPKIKFLQLSGNQGFGAAQNKGAKIAEGEYLWFLNPDTEIEGDGLGAIGKIFEADSEVSIIGPRLLEENRILQPWSVGVEIGWWDLLKNNLGIISSRKAWESEKNSEIDWVSGAAMFVRKADFERLGGFDERFFTYFEDIDLCKRARQGGKKVVFCPQTEVIHKGGTSFDSRKEQKRLFYAAQKEYFNKHLGRWSGFLIGLMQKISF